MNTKTRTKGFVQKDGEVYNLAVTLFGETTEDGGERTRPVIADAWRYGPMVACPCCSHENRAVIGGSFRGVITKWVDRGWPETWSLEEDVPKALSRRGRGIFKTRREAMARAGDLALANVDSTTATVTIEGPLA